MKRHNFGAWILIFIGAVFLLNNFGYLPWSIWNLIWRLWPLLLVFLGLKLIFNSSKVGSWFITTLLVVVLLLILLWILSPINPTINSFFNQYLPSLPNPTSFSSDGSFFGADSPFQ